jgi:hypothetical protein
MGGDIIDNFAEEMFRAGLRAGRRARLPERRQEEGFWI